MIRPVYLEQEHVDYYIVLEEWGYSSSQKIDSLKTHFKMSYMEARNVVAYLEANPGAVNVSPCKECQA